MEGRIFTTQVDNPAAAARSTRKVTFPDVGTIPRAGISATGAVPFRTSFSAQALSSPTTRKSTSAALVDRTRWVAANWVEKFRTHRITLTSPVLNAAAECG